MRSKVQAWPILTVKLSVRAGGSAAKDTASGIAASATEAAPTSSAFFIFSPPQSGMFIFMLMGV